MTLLTPDSNSETADSTKDIKDTNKVVEYVVKLIIREDNTVFEFRNNDIILGWGIFIDLFLIILFLNFIHICFYFHPKPTNFIMGKNWH